MREMSVAFAPFLIAVAVYAPAPLPKPELDRERLVGQWKISWGSLDYDATFRHDGSVKMVESRYKFHLMEGQWRFNGTELHVDWPLWKAYNWGCRFVCCPDGYASSKPPGGGVVFKYRLPKAAKTGRTRP